MAHGRIANLVDRGYGSRLAGDLASGATVVPVDDVFNFNEAENDSGDPIGELQIGEETYEYISTDDDASTITLASATTEDYTDQDWVYLAPATTEKYAIVELDGGGSTEFKVPFLLWAWVEESTRGTLIGEYVRLSWDGQQYVYEDMLGAQKKLNGAVIDPDSTIPPGALTDGLAPSGSPTPTLEPFAIGGLRWSVTPVANADPVRFRVYADTVDPPTIDAAHRVADTGSLSGSFTTIDGARLLPEDSTVAPDPIFVACIEYDADGDADLSATSAAATPRRATNSDVSADYGYFGEIEANQVSAGTFEADLAMVGNLSVGNYVDINGDDSSITIYADAEHTQPLVQLRPNGSVFRGQVIADDVSVLNGLILQGTGSHVAQSAGVTLDSSVKDPAGAPTLTVTPAPLTWPAVPSGYASRGFTWNGTNWIRLIRRTSDGRLVVQTINTSGAFVGSGVQIAATSIDANSLAYDDNFGSPRWFTMIALDDGWAIRRYNASTGAVVNTSSATPWPNKPSVGVATGPGTLVVAHVDSGLLYVDLASLTTLATTSSYPAVTSPSTAQISVYSSYGPYDIGTGYFIVQLGSTAYWYQDVAGVLTPDASLEFDTAGSTYQGGFAWDGSNFYSTHGAALLNKYNGNWSGVTGNAYVTYADTDTGSTKHTKDSPQAFVVLKRRQYIQAVLPPAPAGAATPRVYMAKAASTPADTALLLRAETVTARNVLIDPKVAGGNALVRTKTITNRALTSNVATLTAAAHGFEVGDTVTVASVPTDTFFNGTFVITAVTTNTFSYALVHANVSSVSSAGTVTNTDTNTFGTGTAAWLKTQLGGYQLNGDGTESSPLLGHSDQKVLSADANPTSGTNVAMGSLDMSVTVQALTDVVWVEIDAEIATGIANSLNTIELLIDGSAQSVQLRTRLQSVNDRYSGHKKWRITGLTPGAHAITFRTRNSAGSTDVTIVSAHTVASYWTTT